MKGAAPPGGSFIPLYCLWFRNFIVQGIKFFPWLQLWTRNHDRLEEENKVESYLNVGEVQKPSAERVLAYFVPTAINV